MEVNHGMINFSAIGVSLHDQDEDEDEEEDEVRKVVMERTYNCVFCRRGFTTAQALGGHMNVHRRARVSKSHNQNPRITKSSSSSSCYNSNLPYPLHTHHDHPASKVGKFKGGNGGQRGPSLDFQGCGNGGGGGVNRSLEGKCEDLDLELRLGHHSYC